MKYATFQKRAAKIAEKTIEQGKKRLAYQNTPEALYFTPDVNKAYYAYRLEGSAIAEQPDERAANVNMAQIFDKAMATATYASMIIDYCESLENGTPTVKFRTADCERENVFDRRLVRKFPDNARFYLPRGKWEPAIVGLWENNRLNVIGCVCPIRAF